MTSLCFDPPTSYLFNSLKYSLSTTHTKVFTGVYPPQRRMDKQNRASLYIEDQLQHKDT